MIQLIVTVISTLDGYAAGEDGNAFVMPIDLGFDRYNLERMRAADTMLFGAASFLGAAIRTPSFKRRLAHRRCWSAQPAGHWARPRVAGHCPGPDVSLVS
jgi:hypothetical protein